MVSYHKYDGWWKGHTLSLGQNLFVRNPYPNKKKFDINYIRCCDPVTVELECRVLTKIELKRLELFQSEVSLCHKLISNNFCLAFKGAGDKHEFVKEQVRFFRALLTNDSSIHINYTGCIALRILNIPFTGIEVFMHRSIYNDRCIRNNKTYDHVQPPSSPLYKGKGKDLFARVEAYAQFFLDLLQLLDKFETHLAKICKKANFNPDAPEICDYTNFFSAYFTDEMQLVFQSAWEDVCKPPGRKKPLFGNPEFHSEIFGKMVQAFKKKVAMDIGTARDQHELKYQVSKIYSALRKTLIKGNNYCRSLEERLFCEKAFASAHGAYDLLNDFTHSFKEENHSKIDWHIVISIDMPVFETIILKRFHEKSELVQNPGKYLVDKQKALCSCDTMLIEFGREFACSRDVFTAHWINTFGFTSAQVTEEKFLTLTHDYISKNYLTFDIESEFITVRDPDEKEYQFPVDFYQKYIVKLFIRIQFHLDQRRQKIFEAVEITSAENKNAVKEINLQETAAIIQPNYKWTGSDTDLLELVTAIDEAGVIKDVSGRIVTREELLSGLCKLLNLEIKDPDSKLYHATNRTRTKHPFLDKLSKAFANYCDKLEAKRFED